MLYRNFSSQEGYIHVCNDSYKYTKEALKQRLPIYLHDVKAYTLTENKVIDIKYCPYCGANVENEERSGEIYNIEKGKFYDWRNEKYYDKKGVTK